MTQNLSPIICPPLILHFGSGLRLWVWPLRFGIKRNMHLAAPHQRCFDPDQPPDHQPENSYAFVKSLLLLLLLPGWTNNNRARSTPIEKHWNSVIIACRSKVEARQLMSATRLMADLGNIANPFTRFQFLWMHFLFCAHTNRFPTVFCDGFITYRRNKEVRAWQR